MFYFTGYAFTIYINAYIGLAFTNAQVSREVRVRNRVILSYRMPNLQKYDAVLLLARDNMPYMLTPEIYPPTGLGNPLVYTSENSYRFTIKDRHVFLIRLNS